MIPTDGTISLWVIGLLCFALGLALGCIAAYLLVARYGRTRRLQGELDQLKDKFSDYRDQVTQHFMRTSELVQEMTQSYRAVYEHLAIGAQNLCGTEVETHHIDFPERVKLPDGNPDSTAPGSSHASGVDTDMDRLMDDAEHIPETDTKQETEKTRPIQH